MAPFEWLSWRVLGCHNHVTVHVNLKIQQLQLNSIEGRELEDVFWKTNTFHHFSTFEALKTGYEKKKLVSFLEAILAKSQLCESLFLWGLEVARPVGTMEEMDANHDPGSLSDSLFHVVTYDVIPCYSILFPIMDSDQEIRVNYTYMIRAVPVVAEGESSKSSPVPTSHSL